MPFWSGIAVLLTPRERVGAALVLAVILAFAGIEVIWVGSIFGMMNLTVALTSESATLHDYPLVRDAASFLRIEETRSVLLAVGGGVMIIIALRNGFGLFVTYVRNSFVKSLEVRTQSRLLQSYLSRPYAWFLNQNSAVLIKNLMEEVPQLVSGAILSFVGVLTDGLISLALIAFLFWREPVATSVIMGLVLGVLATIYFSVQGALRRQGVAFREANEGYFRSSNEALGGIKDVLALGREGAFLATFTAFADKKRDLHVSSQLMKEGPRYAVEGLAFLTMIGLIMLLLARNISAAEITGTLVLYGAAGFRIMPAAFRIYKSVADFRFIEGIFEAVCRDIAESRPERWSHHAAPIPFDKELRLQDLGFRYPDSDGDTLCGIELTISCRDSVAFVGSTGAGKSTLVDVVMGLLTPSRGRILVDGRIIDETNVRGWRADIGYVPQHIFLADRSIAENIAFGIPEKDIDRTSLEDAARAAHIHEFICTLPQGYATEVGERGIRLSGGQRQRIGIARALYQHPRLLILDEATSSLDGITENIIAEAIRELHGKTTLIIIAHRLTTVRHCDVIHLLEHGHVSASGSFNDLMSANATFRAMAGGRQGQ